VSQAKRRWEARVPEAAIHLQRFAPLLDDKDRFSNQYEISSSS